MRSTDKVCEFYYEANERFFAAAGDLVDGFFFGNDFGTPAEPDLRTAASSTSSSCPGSAALPSRDTGTATRWCSTPAAPFIR